MNLLRKAAICLLLLIPVPAAAVAEGNPPDEGRIITFWPLVDYRESPREGFSNLSILGPFFKFQRKGEERQNAFRPLFYQTIDGSTGSVATDYLYPVASAATSPDETSFQALKLFRKHTYRKDEGEKAEQSTMLFPFYISGRSEKFGPYTSVFPIYGDIYERFWRDEYHYVLFPLYGRTVTKGTTSTNLLYPFINHLQGENETGFHLWPLYGQASKEGVYNRRFFLWPFFLTEQSGLDTDNPVARRMFFPLYAASDSPQEVSRSWLWPFFGYRENFFRNERENDYFWPLWMTITGESVSVRRFLPFYSAERRKEFEKSWYLWPLYRHDAIHSPTFSQERDRILYFLYSDNIERWPGDGSFRRRMALWPLFLYQSDPRGVSSLSFPAPVEPVLAQEGIEKNWAPFWRIYQQRWNTNGDSAASVFWNLYWHEFREDGAAFELFPLLFYRNEKLFTDLSFLKGLIRYRKGPDGKRLHFFWLPLGPHWDGEGDDAAGSGTEMAGRQGDDLH